MSPTELQDLCEQGQMELMGTNYLEAANTLERAEQQAWETRSFDTLARLYLPLQETRRQIRQRCGEGVVRMHLIAAGPNQAVAAEQLLSQFSTGQLLVAGWQTIEPALQVRRIARQQRQYIETFLASVERDDNQDLLIQIHPAQDRPATSLRIKPENLPADADRGTPETFAGVMGLWERLHTPFLESARQVPDPIQRMQAYRFTLKVDPACELAHQFLADIARHLARER